MFRAVPESEACRQAEEEAFPSKTKATKPSNIHNTTHHEHVQIHHHPESQRVASARKPSSAIRSTRPTSPPRSPLPRPSPPNRRRTSPRPSFPSCAKAWSAAPGPGRFTANSASAPPAACGATPTRAVCRKNIQHSTSNAPAARCRWMSDVQCWMLDVDRPSAIRRPRA